MAAFHWRLLVAALAVSAALTVLLWWLTGGLVGLFLFLPFLFFPRLLRRAPPPTCPRCGRAARPGDRYCPQDGTPLDGA